MNELYAAGFFMDMALENTYDECLEAMFSLRRFGIKLGLSTMRNILKGLDNPLDSISCIHVAGTNGKGSIASALSTILQLTGYKVGLYTSPHLVKFNERICINNQPIPDDHVVKSYHAVKNVYPGNREPTFFEYSTAMAFNEFGNENVDWAVIETGMGGRLDATNILKPALSIISNISVEHKEYLGNTISQIAYEKAGIIKRSVPVVTGARQKSAVSVIADVASKRSAPLYRFRDAFNVRRKSDGTFTYYGIDHTWQDVRTGLLGNYQIDNAALVLAACEVLNKNNNARISLEHIKAGLEKNRWPGRLEVVSTSPLVILDGAHNLIAARNLAKFLSGNLANRKIKLVVGILDDKPYKAMLQSLLPICNSIILTQAKIDRALPPEILYKISRPIIEDITIIPDVDKAVEHAIATALPQDVVCIAGSLYVVGEAKAALG